MNTSRPLTHEEFKDIYSKVPRLCVEVVIKTEKGVLLTLRDHEAYRNLWHIPGGTVLFQEKVTDAAKRVAKEELGIDVTVQDYLGYMEYFSEVEERGYGYSVGIAYLCKPLTADITLSDQAKDHGFFKTLPENIVKEQKEFLEKFFSDKIKF